MEILALDYTKIKFISFIIFISSFLLGIKFPDWDFKFKLRHRNILTHSPLIVLVFQGAYIRNPSEDFRYFIMGSALAIGIHLIFDIYPKGWGGGALLQTPFIKYNFGKRKSQVLLALFIVMCLIISLFNTSSIEDYILCTLMSLIVIIKSTKKEGKIIRPLMTFVILFLCLGSFKYSEVEKLNKNVYNNVKMIIEKVI